MNADVCPPTRDLNAELSRIDAASSRESWLEQMELEILEDLRTSGRWYSYSRRLTFYPRDAIDQVQELDPELIFQHDTAVAAFWLAANLGPEVDRGQMKLNAAAVLEKVIGLAVERMAKQLAEREYEKLMEERSHEH